MHYIFKIQFKNHLISKVIFLAPNMGGCSNEFIRQIKKEARYDRLLLCSFYQLNSLMGL